MIEFFLSRTVDVRRPAMSCNRLSPSISLQNRIPTRVHLWPTVSVLNIHQKCIKLADYYCFPTLCQDLNLFWLRCFPISLNCHWSAVTVTPVTTLDLFSVCIYMCISDIGGGWTLCHYVLFDCLRLALRYCIFTPTAILYNTC